MVGLDKGPSSHVSVRYARSLSCNGISCALLENLTASKCMFAQKEEQFLHIDKPDRLRFGELCLCCRDLEQ